MNDTPQRSPLTAVQVILGGMLFLALVGSYVWSRAYPNSRIGGVAWNDLFQMFGPLAALCYAAFLGIRKATSNRMHIGRIVVMLLLVAVSAWCWIKNWPVWMSV